MLDTAFATLLGRPAAGDPGRYALYYSCTDLADELFALDFDPALLGTVTGPPFAEFPQLGSLLRDWDLIAPRWTVSLAASRFTAGSPEALPELEHGLTGAELARLLAERNLTPSDLRDDYPEAEFRIATDGTLSDALRHATGLMDHPAGLFDLAPAHGTDPHWDRQLSAIPDPALRDHLRHLCRTTDSARSSGARYLGAKDPGLSRPALVTAAWSFGESQSWSAIVADA